MSILNNVKQIHLIKLLGNLGRCAFVSSSASFYDAPAAAAPPNKNLLQILRTDTFGQPNYFTHPHLINEGDLVTGQTVETFRERRIRLMNGLQNFEEENAKSEEQKNKSSLVILPSATKKYISDKIPYVFRQNSDFYYLSGCLEPDTVLVLTINNNCDIKSILFMRPKDKHAELWDGPRTGVENAPDFFGVDEAYSIEQFPKIIKKYFDSETPTVWYDVPGSGQSNITNEVQQIASTTELKSPIVFIQSMRLFKSACEEELMRRTCQIASTAINEVISESKPGISEHHLFAAVDYKCRLKNASYLAYPPVVASGNNATTIHYINNTQLTKSGDMVLMDAGCEYAGYTSDITRTWPINGNFTQPQKVLYDVVLQLQKELIDTLLKPGGETLDELFDTMCIKLGKYLQEVGLVPKYIIDDTSFARAGYKFCPHHVSHYLGMDVHDTPLIPRNLRLLPGMVCTVEPGIYISRDRQDVPKEFRGIGIRIEDDILITHDNNVEVLTAECVKDRGELENIFLTKP